MIHTLRAIRVSSRQSLVPVEIIQPPQTSKFNWWNHRVHEWHRTKQKY